jgi:hypothetical protein
MEKFLLQAGFFAGIRYLATVVFDVTRTKSSNSNF